MTIPTIWKKKSHVPVSTRNSSHCPTWSPQSCLDRVGRSQEPFPCCEASRESQCHNRCSPGLAGSASDFLHAMGWWILWMWSLLDNIWKEPSLCEKRLDTYGFWSSTRQQSLNCRYYRSLNPEKVYIGLETDADATARILCLPLYHRQQNLLKLQHLSNPSLPWAQKIAWAFWVWQYGNMVRYGGDGVNMWWNMVR